MGKDDSFFTTKKPWSIFKDQLLDYYLTPYLTKIMATGRPLLLADCFAGKGRFDDDSEGSPLIIARHIAQMLNQPGKNSKIYGLFIEKKYHEDLAGNLEGYHNIKICPGTFEEYITEIIKYNRSSNLFLYVDPYGIKSLDFQRFRSVSDRGFNSLEMLLNFNSSGFLREGCRILKYPYLPDESSSDESLETDESNNIEHMNQIANGDYWIEIIQSIKDKRINWRQAEELLTENYVRQIKLLFKYVLNIPVKEKLAHVPKYRLIFGTNHPDGLILMADNMNRIWRRIVEEQQGVQGSLFKIDYPDATIEPDFDLTDVVIHVML